MERYSFGRRLAVAGILLLGASSLAACGSSSGETQSPRERAESEPHIETEYYSNGSRLIRYKGDQNYLYGDIIQVCDGKDLLEQTEFIKYGYGAGGAAIARSANHPACEDGRLTSTDFGEGK